MIKTYLVFCIQGYDHYDKAVDTFFKIIDLELIANSYEDALKKAKKLVDKKNFRLKTVIEKYRNDNT